MAMALRVQDAQTDFKESRAPLKKLAGQRKET